MLWNVFRNSKHSVGINVLVSCLLDLTLKMFLTDRNKKDGLPKKESTPFSSARDIFILSTSSFNIYAFQHSSNSISWSKIRISVWDTTCSLSHGQPCSTLWTLKRRRNRTPLDKCTLNIWKVVTVRCLKSFFHIVNWFKNQAKKLNQRPCMHIYSLCLLSHLPDSYSVYLLTPWLLRKLIENPIFNYINM